ncbi:hypothetical protein KVF89_02785 [Nocardioides carbamazepini]|uniref:PaaX family transcriptional regulator C-terminal domain-containing protein n=1 Tax=Nocardioides carbamazepini TaxID=2854259 RepID=UPI00214A5E28|nr:PaaX family transcriptional regulator C-terminal domain-containing protein [Nocardioides carbamazepini]MCR1781447.1 hypothetical protein [Nocardioides carbamazepini]
MNRPIPTRLLVDALVREDGVVDAGELYDVAALLGMTDQQVRLCLKRLVAEGRFAHEGRGRKAVITALADPGHPSGALAPDAEHVRYAYRQDAGLEPWSGTWHLFGFAVPESRRSARDELRETLVHLGAAPLPGGMYVAANAIGDLVEARARHLDVHDALSVLTTRDLRVGGTDDPRRLAASLWPLDEIAERHRALAALARRAAARIAAGEVVTGAERTTLTVEIAAEFDRALTPDPLLPPELLPRPWPGAEARRLARECWAALEALPPAPGESDAPLRLFRLYDDPGGPA